ncbi:hypothetical protein [Amycolatopsis aidingensis]|nr:hypothetical protein [Amycolatopsis aidingensis]
MGPADSSTGGEPADEQVWADGQLDGIPREIVERVGAADTDTAGGCG